MPELPRLDIALFDAEQHPADGLVAGAPLQGEETRDLGCGGSVKARPRRLPLALEVGMALAHGREPSGARRHGPKTGIRLFRRARLGRRRAGIPACQKAYVAVGKCRWVGSGAWSGQRVVTTLPRV